MKKAELLQWKKRLNGLFQRYKYVLLVILVGAVLLLFPPLWEKEEKQADGAESTAIERAETVDSTEELEHRLEQALSRIQGVGHFGLGPASLGGGSGRRRRKASVWAASASGV